MDQSVVPSVVISWATRDGREVRHEGERPYRTAERHTYIGSNLSCFVAVGGTRVDRGAAASDGVVVRVGFNKIRAAHPFFRDIAENATITIELQGLRIDHGDLDPDSVIQHLQYSADQARACGLEGAIDQYNTRDAEESLNETIDGSNGRRGVLDGATEEQGSIRIVREENGTQTMIARIPYALFRHVEDPWVRETPGSFLEPVHFHVEVEARRTGKQAIQAEGATEELVRE